MVYLSSKAAVSDSCSSLRHEVYVVSSVILLLKNPASLCVVVLQAAVHQQVVTHLCSF